MELEKIVTLANEATRLDFLAMYRSLRDVKCDLPVYVIPYDDTQFELPEGARWWKMEPLCEWLASNNAHPTTRKYQCLTIGNYQFVDTDICFLRDPRDVLVNESGFVTSCGHFSNPSDCTTSDSRRYMMARDTLWERRVFNTGQFASEGPLYTVDALMKTAISPEFDETCIFHKWHEQPGINMLVFASGVELTNINLRHPHLQSTWAGNYPEDDYESYWSDEKRKPFLIHWAGEKASGKHKIDNLYLDYLMPSEREEYLDNLAKKEEKLKGRSGIVSRIQRKVERTIRPR